MLVMLNGSLEAAGSGGEYLQYQEPKPTGMSSWFSTLTYVISLILTFAAVLAMAYFASRFLGARMAGGGGWLKITNNRVLQTIPLGQNKAVSIVDAAGKVLVLGVTETSIVLLTEIVEAAEVEKLKNEAQQQVENIEFDDVLQRQLQSLQQMTNRFPKVFSRQQRGQQEHENKNGE
ncbi:flagellar biosynthetic protein FliO [Azotosporobacter soli]|uniref:FliO/MopB family protein n=1 Tax=Azotosporobacter soli TaxID=3055040 RepID=UPI0031FE6724